MRLFFGILFFICCYGSGFAIHGDTTLLGDTVKLKEVVIVEKFLPSLTGFKVSHIDSAILTRLSSSNVSELLSTCTPLFVKSYGNGRSATAGYRGTGANHTEVLWNGVQINSSMLGQADFSIMPVGFSDAVLLFHGSATIPSGGGAFGSSVHLLNSANWDKSFNLNLQQSLGSYGFNQSGIQVLSGNKQWQYVTRFLVSGAENNFPFKIADNAPDSVMHNNSFQQLACTQSVFFRMNSFNEFSLSFWYQNMLTNLPWKSNNEQQQNEQTVSVFNWTHAKNGHILKLGLSHLYQNLYYQNHEASIFSDNCENKYQIGIDYSYKFSNKIKSVSHADFSQSNINTNNYSDKQNRLCTSISESVQGKFLKEKLISLLTVKRLLIDNKVSPFILLAAVELNIKKMKFKANVSNNFRYPTLNDLYWNPGGNPELKPEKGRFSEFGVVYANKLEWVKTQAEFTFFYSDISNLISWQPGSNSNVWTPVNFNHVVTSGIETGIKATSKIKNCDLSLAGNYSFTKAVNQSGGDELKGKQMIYVPNHNANSTMSIFCKKFSFWYSYRLVGSRFIYTDNSFYMPYYQLHDIGADYRLNVGNGTFALQFLVANILNSDYQVVAGYPQMRRNFKVTVKFDFSK